MQGEKNMKIGSIVGNGGGLPLIAGFGIGAAVGILTRYYYRQDYLIPYIDYTINTDVLIPGAVGASGILAGLIMKSSKKYLLFGMGIGGVSTAVVNYFLPKTETSYIVPSSFSSNSCSQKIIT